MKILAFLLFLSSAYAEECDVDPMSLSALAGKKCLDEMNTKKDLKRLLGSAAGTKRFCENCTDPLLDNLVLSSEEIKSLKYEKAKVYGQATLNEFQKELTFMSLDLLKMRSSYKLDLNPKAATMSCNIEKKLRTPKCLNESQKKEFSSQIGKIKNSLASELANIISGAPKAENALFSRTEKMCGISDPDIIFSYMRYTEDLLTPEWVNQVKNLKIPDGLNLETYLAQNTLIDRDIFPILQKHPAINVLFRDTSLLNNFLKGISSNDGQKEILEKLYSKNTSALMAKDISSRCDEAFEKTSNYLEEIYCKGKPSYLADDISSMEALSGNTFRMMTDEEAETNIKNFCATLNKRDKDYQSFTKISTDINKKNDQIISKHPLKTFKKKVYADSFTRVEEQMCKAQKENTCKNEPESPACKMLHYLELSKSSKEYKEMAKASSDNVNLILRSLVGSGLPMSEGKPDYKAVALLKNEGILPGGSSTAHPVQKDVSTFQNETRIAQANNSQKATASKQHTQAAKSPASSQADFSPARIENPLNEQESSSTGAAAAAPTHKAIDPKAFSKLSNKEQNEILKRLQAGKKNSLAKAPKGTNNFADLPEGTSDLTNSFTASEADQSDDPQSKPEPTIANHGKSNYGKDVKLDPAKKESTSYNKALNEANNRSPASDSSQGTISTSNVSGSSASAKSPDPSKQGNLEVTTSDKEVIKVQEFQAKLQEYLKAQKHDLKVSKVGESFLVKIKNIEIKVLYNESKNLFEAVCDNAKVSKPFLQKISSYFNHTLSRGKGKLQALKTELKQARK